MTGRAKKSTVAGVSVALLLGLAAVVWWQRQTVADWLGIGDDAQSAGDELGVNVSEVSDHPEVMWGHQVTVSADLKQRFGDRLLLIGSDAFRVGDQVLVASSTDLDVPDDGPIRVTGEVRRYDQAALSAELGVPVPPELDYDGKAFIVASSVGAAEEGPRPGDTEQRGPSAASERKVSINELTDGIDDLSGETVTVSGEIEQILGPYAMRIGDAKVLVVGSRNEPAFIEATAVATGVVLEFDAAEIEERFGVPVAESVGEPGEPVIVLGSLDVIR